MTTTVYLGLGSNVGDRAANLRAAVAAIGDIADVDAVSPVYESDAVGYTAQDRFLNLAVRVHTALPPAQLLQRLHAVERELGRVETFRMGPRVIDIDILLYGDERVSMDDLTIPHPRMMERAFVLRPLLDLDPTLRHPVTAESLADRLTADGGDATLSKVEAGDAD